MTPCHVSGDREEAEMVRVESVNRDDLLGRRTAILQEHGLTLEEFAARAEQYRLVGAERDAWEELRSISFLLGDDS
jgi:glycine cleavage system regulatory protein